MTALPQAFWRRCFAWRISGPFDHVIDSMDG
jgi:hypothetical protein